MTPAEIRTALEQCPYDDKWNGFQAGFLVSTELRDAILDLLPAAEEPESPAMIAPVTDAENDAAYRRSMAFNAEAARAGLFAAALDIAGEMRKGGVPHADAAILTGAVEFSAQLWQQVGEKAGIASSQIRQNFLKEAKFFYGKHQRASRAGAQPVTHQ